MRLRYLQGYPPELLARAQQLLESGRLAEAVAAPLRPRRPPTAPAP